MGRGLTFALEKLSPVMRAQAERQLARGATVRTVSSSAVAPATRANKFNAQRIREDGKTFDSKHEYLTFVGLRLRERRGDITDLRHKVRFAFFVTNAKVGVLGEFLGTYTADFTYRERSRLVVADAKSKATSGRQDWRRTKALMKACHGIDVQEIFKDNRPQ